MRENIDQDELVWPPNWSCRSCGGAVQTGDGIPLLAPALVDSTSGMDPALFEPLAVWANENFWFAPRNRLIIGVLDCYFPTAETVMEIGCGNRFVLSAISKIKPWRRLVASERHPAALITARSGWIAARKFVQMDARTIPTSEVFDVIGAFDVLEHIEDEKAVLTGAPPRRRYCLDCAATPVAVVCHRRSRTPQAPVRARRQKKVEAAGFRMLFSGSYTALLLPLMMLSRPNRRANALHREFELSPLANGVLKAVLNFEVTLTLAGFRFPAGGSRVVVAVREIPAPRNPSTSKRNQWDR